MESVDIHVTAPSDAIETRVLAVAVIRDVVGGVDATLGGSLIGVRALHVRARRYRETGFLTAWTVAETRSRRTRPHESRLCYTIATPNGACRGAGAVPDRSTSILLPVTVERMDHIGVVVQDLEAATALFLELGLSWRARRQSRVAGWTASSRWTMSGSISQ